MSACLNCMTARLAAGRGARQRHAECRLGRCAVDRRFQPDTGEERRRTYAATLSLAYDHDLAYQRRSDRFWGLYKTVRGRVPQDRQEPSHSSEFDAAVPARQEARSKPIAVLEQGVHLFRVRGALRALRMTTCHAHVHVVVRVSLLASPSGPALLSRWRSLAPVVPVALFLMPDLFNFAGVRRVFLKYAEARRGTSGSDGRIASSGDSPRPRDTRSRRMPRYGAARAAALRSREAQALVGVVFVVGGRLFGVNALITEFNYQGGIARRSTARSRSNSTRDVWNANAALSTTNDADCKRARALGIRRRLAHNVEYFFVGRHFGFAVALHRVICAVGWAFARPFSRWRTLTFLALVGATGSSRSRRFMGRGGPQGNGIF